MSDENKPQPNLSLEIIELLKKHNHPNPEVCFAKMTVDLTQYSYEQQRKLINNHLRLVIGAFDQDTTNVRYGIDDRCSYEDWIRLMELSVVPFLVEHVR